MPALAGIKIEGQRDLIRAFGKVDASLKKDMLGELKRVAEPVKSAATQFAQGNISNIGARWSEFKIGGTAKTVYVAPKARRRGGSPRSNLGGLLVKRAMLPAIDQQTPAITRDLERWLDSLAARFN